jgi:hypothetical protein
MRRQLQLQQLLLWPLGRKDKQGQNEEERVEGLVVVVIPLAVRASGGIGSPAQAAESNSHVCQRVTAPAWKERCRHSDQDHGNQDRDQDRDLPPRTRRWSRL